MMKSSELYETLSCQYMDVLNKPDSDWLTVFQSAEKKHIPAGTCIFRETEQCRNFMWLLEGVVRVYKHSPGGREITLYRVTPGELCVLSLQCLMDGGGFPAVAIAETDLLGLSLSKHEFENAIDESKAFRRYLLKVLTQRLSDVVQLVSDVTFHRLELRLACLLGLLFKNSSGAALKITHSKLAHELGTTREMISRILKELEHKQCVRLSRGFIHLVSEDALEWFSKS